MSKEETIRALSDFLRLRVKQARAGELSTKSLEEIKAAARRQAGL